jgi:RNA polymerase sigma-70 factor (ECF subfamily)
MAVPTDDRDLLDLYKAGSETAATELFDKYCEQLLRLAEKRIGARMNSRLDPEDVVQSAFRTFFGRAKADKFTFEDQDDLFKLLVRITVHKTLRQIAFHRAAKRNPSQEAGQGDTANDMLLQAVAAGPTPETEVALIDQFESFMSQLPAQDRQILELRIEGYSTDEIATKLGSYDRKVRRVLERIRGLAESQKVGIERAT